MLRLLFCKNVLQKSFTSRNNNHVCFPQIQIQIQIQSILQFCSNSTNYHIPTVSYLVEKCGLSLDSAISTSKKMYKNIESPEKPDSVLQLFKTYGFNQTQIADLITKRPPLILADPVKTLQPKFEFFELSLGLSKPDVANIVSSCILERSLENQIIPAFNVLKCFLHTKENILAVLKQCNWLANPEIEPNIVTLLRHGVTLPNISKLIILKPVAVMQKKDWFSEIVRAIEEKGFDINTWSFVHAIIVMGSMSKWRWSKKVECYKSFGWSEEDVISAFKLQPRYMLTAEKKIIKLMEFYLNNLGLQPSVVAKHPNLMLVSLEKRIIPRCSVLQVLLLKGLIGKDLNLMTALIADKSSFEKKYVNKYKETAPEVLKAYQGELGSPDFERLSALLRIGWDLENSKGICDSK